jgi:hypothetical protein
MVATAAARIGTCNVQDNPDLPRRDVVKAGKLVGPRVGICGFQEIWGPDDRVDLRTGMGSDFGWVDDGHHGIPIAYRKSQWKVATAAEMPSGIEPTGYAKGHGAHGSDSHHAATPERGYQWAGFLPVSSRVRTTMVVNLHPINGGWSKPGQPGDWDPPGPEESDRRERWYLTVDKAKAFVVECNKAGLSVFLLGDLNRHNMPRLLPNERRLVDTGIDKIYLYPVKDGTGWKQREQHTINTPSDHNARVVTGSLFNR